ncbi:MAG: hypothetical protein K5656_06130 [Lachnospiraceae bacterium]|nr:hypothetical protein [Lachnospiraceae bacterium]
MNYKEACDYVNHIPRYKKKFNQDNILHLLETIGRPDSSFKSIHIVGTNGKGSVAAFLNSIGRSKGFKMGVFTSPHLLTIRERFVVNGTLISEEDFVKYLEQVLEAEETILEDGFEHLTFFEIMFAMALLYFKDEGVDYAIIEAGMGGRSDSTNSLKPEITVITAIGLDHQSVLGDTIEKIAYEKAGAVNQGEVVTVSRQSKNVLDIIEDYIYVVGGEAIYANNLVYNVEKADQYGIDFCLNYDIDKSISYHLSMSGLYQVDNAVVSIMTARVLWNMDYEELVTPLSNVSWAGRMQEVANRFYVDGAHNHQAVQSFVATVKNSFTDSPKILIYAVACDKDDRAMLKELLKLSIKVLIVTELSNGRKTEASQIVKLVDDLVANECLNKPESVLVETTIDTAISYAQTLQGEDDYIFAVGSLYLVSDVMKRLIDQKEGDKDD